MPPKKQPKKATCEEQEGTQPAPLANADAAAAAAPSVEATVTATATETGTETGTFTESSTDATPSSQQTTDTTGCSTEASKDTQRQEQAAASARQDASRDSARSRVSTVKQRRSLRLAKAREQVAQLQLELAAARVAVLEAEDTGDEADDNVSVYSATATARRVGEWLEGNQILAITHEPHETPRQEPPPPLLQVPPTVQPVQHAEVHREEPPARPAQPPAPPQAPVQTRPDMPPACPILSVPVQSQNSGGAYADNSVALPNNSIAELAAAITLAARSARPPMNPRYITELQAYSGSHHEWLAFKASYFDTTTLFTEVENMARLRRALKGKAKEAVENLLIYSANTTEVMQTLEARFGRPDTIALSELERLRALARPTDAPRDICTFSSRLTNAVATLKALDRAHYLYSPETAKVVVDKLTPTLRYRWFDFAADASKEDADLIKLAKFLQREAERCGPYAQPEASVTEPAGGKPRQATPYRPQPAQQKVYATSGGNNNNNNANIKCPLCSEPHKTDSCVQFKDATIDERWDIAKSNGLCFSCLGHRSRTHRCKRRACERDGCGRWHHKMLHFSPRAQTEAVNTAQSAFKAQAYLKIIPVTLSGPSGDVSTYALLDDGSTVTLVDEDLAVKIGADGPTGELSIQAIGETRLTANSRRVTLRLKGASGDCYDISARTINNLHLSTQTVAARDIRDCEHLRNLGGLVYTNAEPRILIGQDQWNLLTATETRQGTPCQPVASRTALGWVLHGARTRSMGREIATINHISTEQSMDIQLKRYFALESLLIEPKQPRTDATARSLAILEERVCERDGTYTVPLLWKSADTVMPPNYNNTLQRLHSLEKKLDRDSELRRRYHGEMDALIKKGYAEPAPPTKQPRSWYLPHFAVINAMKPDKVRVVHDAAAKTRGVSLNDHLMTGPDLLQSLPGVLMRFRQHRVAVCADIREMFMQVKVRDEDRDALRYLWRGDRRDNAPPDEYRMTSLIFGATCSPAIAIYVKNRNAERHAATHPEAVSAIIRNHYVDDYLASYKTEQEAADIARQVRDIHRGAHYELARWTSNSQVVLQSLDVTEQAPTVGLDGAAPTERVLGLIWRPTADVLEFNLNLQRLPTAILERQEPTKRDILKILMSVFDPLGLAAPVTIGAKQILQEVWRRGTDWDTKIDRDLAAQWHEWMSHLTALRDVSIDRCYLHYSDATNLQLHVFVDASETAYAAALYWRATDSSGAVHTSLITAKAKVAPLTVKSIPRLELQAAAMGSRMASAVVDEHNRKPQSKVFWSDSRTVLTWLKKGARTYLPFVAHRIAAVEEHSTVKEWRWVPTKLNVADDATRAVPRDFNSTHRWYTGPEFLRRPEEEWPCDEPAIIANTGEEKVHNITEKRRSPLTEATPLPERFSRWERLIRATARVLQFIQVCRGRTERVNYKRTQRRSEEDGDWRTTKGAKKTAAPPPIHKAATATRHLLPLSAEILRDAEKLVIRASQQRAFADDIEQLTRGLAPTPRSRLRPLAVELLNGTIILKTRIGATRDIGERQMRPPVIDGGDHATQLYIAHVHRQLHHAGTESTINECRQHFWVLRLRPTTKGIISRCLACRIRRAAPPTPPTGNHPPTRVGHHNRPFTFTGVDYFGPLSITAGRTRQKRYVALFTCLTTRAIHLEMAASLSVESAVMAVRRMIARRGCPTELWSDNGTNLRAADKELRRAMDAATAGEAARRGIKWRFIPPGAPFMGGAWERMVRSVKTALAATLHERHPMEEVLTTLLAEVELTVNSRPLTHVSVDPADPEALTPNHFLLHGSAHVPVVGTFDDSDLIGRTHWRASQRLADIFWERWLREYLPSLQNRREPRGRGPELKLGDIVIIADNTLPRNVWPLGKVTATYPGADGVVRAADVFTRGTTLRRPTKKLVIVTAGLDDVAHATEDCIAPVGNTRRE